MRKGCKRHQITNVGRKEKNERRLIVFGGAMSWPAVAERCHGSSSYALSQPEPEGVSTSTDRDPQSILSVFHFLLAATIRILVS